KSDHLHKIPFDSIPVLIITKVAAGFHFKSYYINEMRFKPIKIHIFSGFSKLLKKFTITFKKSNLELFWNKHYF
ncbi:MAG: hypothetical protein ACTHKC_00780, partial [Candidatus Nitrosocosmicus sp.]